MRMRIPEAIWAMNHAKSGSDLTIGLAFGTLAAKECKSLQRALAMKKQRQSGIHRARKSCRRLRSLLVFIGPKPTKQAIVLDNTLRELLRGLSALRDAHIAKRTARLLASAHETTLTPVLLAALQKHSTTLLRDALKADPDWRRKRYKAERLAIQFQRLPWQEIHPSWVKEVIALSAKRVKKTRKRATDQRAPDAFHRWRRRARKLRYQLELASHARKLAGMKKAPSKRYAERAEKLALVTDRLGWRQDFQVFLQTLDQLADTCVDAAASSAALKRKSSELSLRANVSGRKTRTGHAYIARESAYPPGT